MTAALRKLLPFVGTVAALFVVLNLISWNRGFSSGSNFSFSETRVYTKTYDNDNQTNIDETNEQVFNTVLRDIHIVMIGDVNMRYQYLSLVYRLRFGIWFDHSLSNFDLMNAQTFESPFHSRTTAEFCYQTNLMLQPTEVCDCYFSAQGRNDTIENRYYYDSDLNNSIAYLAASGIDQSLRGRLLPHQIRNMGIWWQRRALNEPQEVSWYYSNWADGISKYIRNLDPPPKHIVMSLYNWNGTPLGLCNTGRTPTNNRSSIWYDDLRDSLQVLKNNSDFHFVWQAAACGNQLLDYDQVMCKAVPTCLNLPFTQSFLDERHLQEPAYRIANVQLLSHLGYLPDDNERLSLSKLSLGLTQRAKALRRQNHYPNALIGYDASSIYEADSTALLRDIHIVLVGDSLTRYQYSSLVYRLRFGVWFNESQWHYNLVKQGSYESPFHIRSWGEFLFHSSNVLYPYELCDCYRRPLNVVENHYYHDPYLNNSIVYISAMGHWKKRSYVMRGRILPDQIQQEMNNQSSFFKKGAFGEMRDIIWSYADWGEAILNHIRLLDPRPKHIVLNAGIWQSKFCDRPNDANDISNATSSLSKETQNLLQAIKLMPEFQFVWKTSTFDKLGKEAKHACDDLMCSLFPACLNMSFTRHVRRNNYWDQVHFYEPVYRAMNELMLDELGYLPEHFNRYNVTDILNYDK